MSTNGDLLVTKMNTRARETENVTDSKPLLKKSRYQADGTAIKVSPKPAIPLLSNNVAMDGLRLPEPLEK
jgi:hypothetical protein